MGKEPFDRWMLGATEWKTTPGREKRQMREEKAGSVWGMQKTKIASMWTRVRDGGDETEKCECWKVPRGCGGLTPCASESKAECLVTQFGRFLPSRFQHKRPICFISSCARRVGIPHSYSTTASAREVNKSLPPQTLTQIKQMHRKRELRPTDSQDSCQLEISSHLISWMLAADSHNGISVFWMTCRFSARVPMQHIAYQRPLKGDAQVRCPQEWPCADDPVEQR